MKRRSAIGQDPLDAIVPLAVESTSHAGDPTGEKKTGLSRRKATFHLDGTVLDEARSAVLALSGPPLRLTLSGLVEGALRKELERLRKAQNAGKPFYAGDATVLRRGRPLQE